MELGVLTTDIPNQLSCKFEMFTFKIAQVIQAYLSVAFLYVLSIFRQNPKVLIHSSSIRHVRRERQTRSTTLDLMHIPRSHSASFDRALSFQGPKLWNSLPADIRYSKSIIRFKSELKRYLLYNN